MKMTLRLALDELLLLALKYEQTPSRAVTGIIFYL
jgi:hypothetical protein